MSNQSNMIQPTNMLPQEVKPLPGGSIYTAAIADGNSQTQSQMNLVGQGKSGGTKKRRRMMGGDAPVVQVPSVPSSAVDPAATGANYTGLTQLSQQQANQAVYDSAKDPSQTAAIQQQQQALYKGGSRKGRKGRKGISGRKSCNCKKIKNKRTKRHWH
jgi:hypothetical protein